MRIKKFCYILLFFGSLAVSAEAADNILLDNFEGASKNWQPVDNGWVTFQIVDNPAPDAVNSSAKVMKIIRNTNTANYAGVILRNYITLTFGTFENQYRYAHLKMLKTADGDVTFKLENNGDADSFSNTRQYTAGSGWKDIVFDMGGAGGKSFDDFFIMPDRTDYPPQAITVYIDDIEFSPDPDALSGEEIELPGEFQLVWSDEFDGASYDAAIWSPQIAGGGFGNNELQYYTGNANNIFTRNGCLVLKAIKETYQNHAYTSGKIWTQSKKFFKYGRVEARFKLPAGRGTWPAIWMMPQESVYGGWPNSGEIDIMEFVGYDANKIYGTVHRGDGSGGNGDGSSIYMDNPDEFHKIRIDWEPGYIKWYMDDVLFHTYNNTFTNSAQWPFDRNFYVILNFAVGGNWGGAQGIDQNIWPQEFLIDYVRVYQKPDVSTLQNNLTNGKLTIASLENNKLEIKTDVFPLRLNIFSLAGERVLTKLIDSCTAIVDISVLPQGMYIIEASDGQNIHYSQKILK
ncbi:MAG: family 16 glycosylhydrolase [Prevotellaceae bacterium]|jgi:beta-glucanase (GH16 family)|nr:family 16 glycosylhydrolase [Prevotellaceae bacterium]